MCSGRGLHRSYPYETQVPRVARPPVTRAALLDKPAVAPNRSSGFVGLVHDFAPLNFFLFCGGAKFGEFRLTLPAQVVC